MKSTESANDTIIYIYHSINIKTAFLSKRLLKSLAFAFKNQINSLIFAITMSKFTQSYLDKLEDLFGQADYTIRYEKGNFKSGFCILENLKVIVVNKFSTIENKIGFLSEALRQLPLDETMLDEKSRKLLRELKPADALVTETVTSDVAADNAVTDSDVTTPVSEEDSTPQSI